MNNLSILINSIICFIFLLYFSISKNYIIFYISFIVGFFYSINNVSILKKKFTRNTINLIFLSLIFITFHRLWCNIFLKKYGYFQDLNLDYTKKELKNHINKIIIDKKVTYKVIQILLDFGWILFRYLAIKNIFGNIILLQLANLLCCITDFLETSVYISMFFNKSYYYILFPLYRILNIIKYLNGYLTVPSISMAFVHNIF